MSSGEEPLTAANAGLPLRIGAPEGIAPGWFRRAAARCSPGRTGCALYAVGCQRAVPVVAGEPDMSTVRISVAGTGLIGRRHIEEVHASPRAELASIVDPGAAGPEVAQRFTVPLYRSLAELFDRDKPDGVILATPNQMH